MEHSPKGRLIEELEGNGEAVAQRGKQITELGDAMIESATTLQQIAEGASGQKGLTVEQLEEVVGECYKELKLAGERYKPTGAVLEAYGNVVTIYQPLIRRAVDDCQTQWDLYQSKKGSIPSVPSLPGTTPGTVFHDATDEEREAHKEAQDEHDDAQAAADRAYEAWIEEAETFDSHYDGWEDAFDRAANAIEDADEGGIEDGFWDKVDGFVEAALEVLKYVGIALAIAALIIGGPIMMLLAAGAAILTLGATAYSFARGNSSGWDLAFAIVGVIPLGGIGTIARGFKSGMATGLKESLSRGFKSMGSEFLGGATLTNLSQDAGQWAGALRGFSHGLKDGMGSAMRGFTGSMDMSRSDVLGRLFAGQRGQDLVNTKGITGALDVVGGHYKQVFSNGKLATYDIPTAFGAGNMYSTAGN